MRKFTLVLVLLAQPALADYGHFSERVSFWLRVSYLIEACDDQTNKLYMTCEDYISTVTETLMVTARLDEFCPPRHLTRKEAIQVVRRHLAIVATELDGSGFASHVVTAILKKAFPCD